MASRYIRADIKGGRSPFTVITNHFPFKKHWKGLTYHIERAVRLGVKKRYSKYHFLRPLVEISHSYQLSRRHSAYNLFTNDTKIYYLVSSNIFNCFSPLCLDTLGIKPVKRYNALRFISNKTKERVLEYLRIIVNKNKILREKFNGIDEVKFLETFYWKGIKTEPSETYYESEENTHLGNSKTYTENCLYKYVENKKQQNHSKTYNGNGIRSTLASWVAGSGLYNNTPESKNTLPPHQPCPFNGLYDAKSDTKYHLIFALHGATTGPKADVEELDFTKDFEKTLKAVSGNLEAMCECPQCVASHPGSKYHPLPSGGGVIVIPVRWRDALKWEAINLLDSTRKLGLSDPLVPNVISNELNQRYPTNLTIKDIRLNAIPGFISTASDIACEILSYSIENSRREILKSTAYEINRLYSEFKKRYPNFKGTISICAHSLGSLIAFDLLCDQWDYSSYGFKSSYEKDNVHKLNFDVENFFSLGSPLALYLLLRGQKILFRSTTNESPVARKITVSPKVENFYNIFHPSDSVSHRLEPLIAGDFPKLDPYEIRTPVLSSYSRRSSDVHNSKYPQTSSTYTLLPKQAHSLLNSFPLFSIYSPPIVDVVKTVFTLLTGAITPAQINSSEIETGTPNGPEVSSHTLNKCKKVVETLNALEAESGCLLNVININPHGRLDFVLPKGTSALDTILDYSYIYTVISHFSYWTDTTTSLFIMQQLHKNSLYIRPSG